MIVDLVHYDILVTSRLSFGLVNSITRSVDYYLDSLIQVIELGFVMYLRVELSTNKYGRA